MIKCACIAIRVSAVVGYSKGYSSELAVGTARAARRSESGETQRTPSPPDHHHPPGPGPLEADCERV